MNENNEAIAKYYIQHPDLLASLLDEINNQAGILVNKTPVKIIVNVYGWKVQDVFSTDQSVEVTILDWDNIDNKDGSPELEYVKEGDYPVDVVTEQEIKDRIAEANNHIQKNIEDEVEQRR